MHLAKKDEQKGRVEMTEKKLQNDDEDQRRRTKTRPEC